MNTRKLYAAILDAVADSGTLETDTLRWLVAQYYPQAQGKRAEVDYAIADLLAAGRLVWRGVKLGVR